MGLSLVQSLGLLVDQILIHHYNLKDLILRFQARSLNWVHCLSQSHHWVYRLVQAPLVHQSLNLLVHYGILVAHCQCLVHFLIHQCILYLPHPIHFHFPGNFPLGRAFFPKEVVLHCLSQVAGEVFL